MNNDQLQHLKELVKLTKEGMTRSEFTKSFKNVVDLIVRVQKQLIEKIDKALDVLTKKVDAKLAEVKDGKDGADGKDGRDGKDGKNGEDGYNGIDGKNGKDGKDGKDGSPDTGDQIIEKINTQSNKKIVKQAIEGVEELEKELVKVREIRITGTRSFFGAKGIGLYIGGAKKLLTAQAINLVAGSGVSINYNYANGRNDITISASGTGSFSLLTATGNVNDTNTAFTFASEPVVVVVNGASYRNGSGCTISGTNVTLDNPVGSGGGIYGLG